MSTATITRTDRSHDFTPANAGRELCLRSFRAKDGREVLRFYRHGLLAGVPDPLDLATDFDGVEDVYLKRSKDHFWVAKVKGHVVASIAITADDRQVGHIRRLRADTAWKIWSDGEVAAVQIAKATHHARQHDCLKPVLHEPVNDGWAIALLHQLGFEYARARKQSGRPLLEFYLDLYV